ncbi:DinB family protein [Bacillus sp. REN10]|uniref:DinB family protein n=1 Tax=Bacillus sp. REN10 TaxID=2782541 RepID=UPI00193B9A21|nr:DinB family protein [Bacillus sp. REN10]
MFQSLNGFLKSWEFESGATQKILNTLTNESLEQEITSDNWNLGQVAWHLVTVAQVLISRTGLKFDSPAQDMPVPTSAKVIADHYAKTSKALIEAIKTQWTDDSLQEQNDFFGQQQPNALFLMTLIHHQIHHRGQMTVLMRQAGLTVPGVYGPSKEEWGAMEIEASKM